KFTNTSTADEKAGAEILSSQWDFDTESQLPNADSNGDGKKDNDTDSQAKNPERLFTEEGAYKIKLTVTDNQGNKDEVINPVKLPLANPPLAAFTYEVKNGEVVFKNTSTADIKTGSIITKYAWDFDLNTDTNGDGKKDNDIDSQIKDPTHIYPQTGTYQVKLTVVDNQGGSAEIANEVSFTASTGGTGGTGGAIPVGDLKAVMSTSPAPSADSYIYLSGNSGTVQFDFSKSTGAIKDYIFDKNIYFDTNGNGDKADEQDFKTSLPGTWSTNFDKAWGKIVVKLTIVDIYGNKNSTTQEIKFN
ncbi:MAG: PKD domain-containing protein, partial [Patescibacteria group bacterium]